MYEEYDHLPNEWFIKSIDLYDRCKCERCQKHKKSREDVLNYRKEKQCKTDLH